MLLQYCPIILIIFGAKMIMFRLLNWYSHHKILIVKYTFIYVYPSIFLLNLKWNCYENVITDNVIQFILSISNITVYHSNSLFRYSQQLLIVIRLPSDPIKQFTFRSTDLGLFAGSAALSPAVNGSVLRRPDEIAASNDGRPEVVAVVPEKRVPDSRSFGLSATLRRRCAVAAKFASLISRLK